ncbi:ABC transporter ATP-binding protein [Magnetospirillum sp. 15-1]|uniref:ABC transporter ATP-binding protein n=1 Tax=Magnetospirillum sp. 15-1 TaxID=1979370 RepID=UPI000BBCDCFE|nr:ABC transporter ATP-binding protein [Magnetospirillum sp. 15-1]
MDTGTIELSGIGHTFGRHGPRVLDGITLKVPHGQFLALVGRSGCGKSTLLHMIAGLIQPQAGEVRIGGRVVRAPSAKWDVMFQSPSLLPWMTAAGNVALGLRYAKAPKAEIRSRVEELLALVHLSEHAGDNVQDLSGGQQQRVALARSLATRPDVLLLDEPFSALDPFTRATLQQEVRTIAAGQGLTLVIVTHDVDEALLMAGRAVVMAPRPGRIVADIALPDRQHDERAFAEARAAVLARFEAASPSAVPDRISKSSIRRFFFPALGRQPQS